MKITLKDGSVKEYAGAMSVIDIANDISEGLARAACAGEINGKVVDLRTVVDSDCELSILTFNDEEGKKAYRHTASHVLAEAVKRLYPEAKCAIGPAIDEGFYYDFDTPPFSRDDLDKLEAEIKKIIKEGHELTRFTLSRDEAIKFMEEKGLVLSMCLGEDPRQIAEMAEVIQECPNLRVAIGHFGMVTTSAFESQVKLALEGRNVMIESGGITWLYNSEFYPYPSAVRSIRQAADWVGMDRLMWGSDYPRTITAITYRMSYDFIIKSSELTAEQKAAFLGENARLFYGLGNLPDLPYIKNMSE